MTSLLKKFRKPKKPERVVDYSRVKPRQVKTIYVEPSSRIIPKEPETIYCGLVEGDVLPENCDLCKCPNWINRKCTFVRETEF